MLASHLPASFLDTYSLSTSSLGCNALCIAINFLVLWSMCLNSLVHLKNGPEYLSRIQPRYLSLCQGFCDIVLSRVIFWFFGDTLFYFLFSFPLVWWCLLPISLSKCTFSFLRAFWWLLNLEVRLLLSCIVWHFSLLVWWIFLCNILFLYVDCIFSQSVLGFPILFRFWQKGWCRPCTSSGRFFLQFTEFLTGCAFPKDIVEWNHDYHK